MWGSLLGLSLLISLNPVLLGFILLVISRPRPVQNLFVYWIGAMAVNVPVFVVPLVLLHVTPASSSFAQMLTTQETSTGTIRPMPLVLGAVLLTIVAVLVARLRLREHAKVPAAGGDSAETTQDPPASGANAGPRGRVKDGANKAVTALRDLFGRLTTSWENGSLWVAFVFGMMYLPSATLVLLIDSTIVASGVGIGEQIIAAIAFVVGFLAVLEIVLFSSLTAPAKTEALLRPVHEWARAHNGQILIVFVALIGVWQLARGFSLA